MDKERKMFALIETWEKSGQSQSAFCTAHSISLSKFGYWRSKWLAINSSSEDASSPTFIPINPIEIPAADSITNVHSTSEHFYEIIYPNGVQLRLPSLDLSVLAQLLNLNV